MSNAKIENLLNLALDANNNEREKSGNLGVGYIPASNTWEVIIRYVRNGLEQVKDLLLMYGYETLISNITVLSNSYAVLILPEVLVGVATELFIWNNQRDSFLPQIRQKESLVLRFCSKPGPRRRERCRRTC